MSPQSKTAVAGTTTVSNAALEGGSVSTQCMEMTMNTNTPTRPGGATTAISPSLGRAYRSGAATVDQLLVELADQFIADAKAIDPTITGGWMYRDLTRGGRERDPHGAVQGFYLEREHAPLVRKAGA